jgi:hypothetical protein
MKLTYIEIPPEVARCWRPADWQSVGGTRMTTWIFFGKVRPERFPVSWGEPIKGHLIQEAFNLEADFSTFIHVAQVTVILTLTKGSTDIDSLRNIALDCAHRLTDLVGYASGCSFDVEIISACCAETGAAYVFGVKIPALAERSNPHRGSGKIDGDLVVTVSENVSAQMVLRDFQLAMRDAIGTGFYCYRAIEAMMQSMKDDTIKTDKQAWEQLNSVLQVARSASEKIKSHADFARHGKPSGMSDQDRVDVFKLTDEIVYRFLEYLRRGSEPLSSAEFPILDAQARV